MTPAALAKLRSRAEAAIASGFDTELVLGRSRSTARKQAEFDAWLERRHDY